MRLVGTFEEFSTRMKRKENLKNNFKLTSWSCSEDSGYDCPKYLQQQTGYTLDKTIKEAYLIMLQKLTVQAITFTAP